MPYCSEISRAKPTGFLFLIDQSASMDETLEHGGTKSSFVADVLNKTLAQLCIRCARAEGIRDYFEVCVLAYGGDHVGNGFAGELGGTHFQPISKVEASPMRIEVRTQKVPDGAGGIVEQSVRFPIWFEPKTSGGTPMRKPWMMQLIPNKKIFRNFSKCVIKQ